MSHSENFIAVAMYNCVFSYDALNKQTENDFRARCIHQAIILSSNKLHSNLMYV